MGSSMTEERMEELSIVTYTNIKCAECDTTIHLTEEVYELKIVTYEHDANGFACYDVLKNDVFEYPPYYFDFECWERLQEVLHEQVEDNPGAKIEDQLGILTCDICESDIRAGELLGLARYGELHCSKRSPNGERICVVFESMENEVHVCIVCLHNMNHEVEYWPDGVEPIQGMDVCWDGLPRRCWRRENCDGCPHRKP